MGLVGGAGISPFGACHLARVREGADGGWWPLADVWSVRFPAVWLPQLPGV